MGKFTNEDLKIMQSWSLEQKIKTTQAKIIEFGYVYSDKIYVLLHKVFVNPYLQFLIINLQNLQAARAYPVDYQSDIYF